MYRPSMVDNLSYEMHTKTCTCFAIALARSLHVSVLPVPAGPSGAPPKFSFRAPINVLKLKVEKCQ